MDERLCATNAMCAACHSGGLLKPILCQNGECSVRCVCLSSSMLSGGRKGYCYLLTSPTVYILFQNTTVLCQSPQQHTQEEVASAHHVVHETVLTPRCMVCRCSMHALAPRRSSTTWRAP